VARLTERRGLKVGRVETKKGLGISEWELEKQ
jgi:hypothetical protein